MKMKMKRVLSALLVLCMIFSLAACTQPSGGNESEPTPPNNTNTDAPAPTQPEGEENNRGDLPHFKIAFSYNQFTDKLGMQNKACLEYLGEAFNVEMVFFESGSGDEAVSNLESVLAAGDIDGVIQVGTTPAQVAVANKYNVPYLCTGGFPSLPEEIASITSYDNFLGGVLENDEWMGFRIAEALYEAGCRNIGWCGMPQGLRKSHDDRAAGVQRSVSSHDDMNLLAEAYNLGEWANDVSSFHAAFPEMDGIGFTAMLDQVYLAYEAEGIADGSVKIAACDISSQTGEYFKKGVQVWSSGGTYACTMVAWAIMYNYLMDGTVIIPDPAVPLARHTLEIMSYEDFQAYEKYVESPLPVYDADEIAQMVHYFNPDITYDDYVEEGTIFSLEDIIARHGDRIS